MPITRVDENALLGWCWRTTGADAAALAGTLDDEQVQALRGALAAVLIEEPAGHVEVESIDLPQGAKFRSVVYRDVGTEGTQRMVVFGFRDAAVEAMLPLFGLAITVFTGHFGWGSASSIVGLAKGLWSKLTVLKRPTDADAIDVLEAIVRVRARHAADGRDDEPTGADIAPASAVDEAARGRALHRLMSMKIIEATRWGGQANDVSHPDNRWRVKL